MLFFSTHNRDNIVLAHDRRMWAVNHIKNESQLFRKAENVKLGTLAFFWVSTSSPNGPSTLMMPSIITSKPDIHAVKVDDPWKGEWCCPFSIHPLMHYDDKSMSIEDLRKIFGNATSKRLLLSGNFAFQPTDLTQVEVEGILKEFF